MVSYIYVHVYIFKKYCLLHYIGAGYAISSYKKIIRHHLSTAYVSVLIAVTGPCILPNQHPNCCGHKDIHMTQMFTYWACNLPMLDICLILAYLVMCSIASPKIIPIHANTMVYATFVFQFQGHWNSILCIESMDVDEASIGSGIGLLAIRCRALTLTTFCCQIGAKEHYWMTYFASFNTFIKENALENFVCKMTAILFRLSCVKWIHRMHREKWHDCNLKEAILRS